VPIPAGSPPPAPPPASLVLPARLYDALLTHLLTAAPLEGVGLLAIPEGDEGGTAVRFYPGTNGAASPTRYTMPPEEVLAAFQDMEANGWRLGAIVHSHPRGPATPSPTDLREAFYPEALMVIVSLAGPTPQPRAWWIGAADGRPREVPIVVGDAPAPGRNRDHDARESDHDARSGPWGSTVRRRRARGGLGG
jgi:[CysO sulfur-carrier protein]-S-L-cysteine hydrolase